MLFFPPQLPSDPIPPLPPSLPPSLPCTHNHSQSDPNDFARAVSHDQDSFPPSLPPSLPTYLAHVITLGDDADHFARAVGHGQGTDVVGGEAEGGRERGREGGKEGEERRESVTARAPML